MRCFTHCWWRGAYDCRGEINKKGYFSPFSRRGLLAYVYSGVSLTKNALVAGIGSYIVRLSVRDLHGPTSPFFCLN